MADVLAAKPTLEWQGQPVMKGPFGYEGAENRFFENLGGGRFRDATAAFGLVDAGKFYSFGVEALDVDGDADLDLYVANDSNPNYLYLNDGKGRFQEVGLWSGAALDAGGNAQGGMGVGAGDTDGDGDPELLVTNFWSDATTLYRNEGEALFTDVARATGVAEPSFMPLEWGTTLSDLDLDGDLDMVIANGHIYPQADNVPAAGPGYKQRNLLLANERGQFTDVTSAAGPRLRGGRVEPRPRGRRRRRGRRLGSRDLQRRCGAHAAAQRHRAARPALAAGRSPGRDPRRSESRRRALGAPPHRRRLLPLRQRPAVPLRPRRGRAPRRR